MNYIFRSGSLSLSCLGFFEPPSNALWHCLYCGCWLTLTHSWWNLSLCDSAAFLLLHLHMLWLLSRTCCIYAYFTTCRTRQTQVPTSSEEFDTDLVPKASVSIMTTSSLYSISNMISTVHSMLFCYQKPLRMEMFVWTAPLSADLTITAAFDERNVWKSRSQRGVGRRGCPASSHLLSSENTVWISWPSLWVSQ